MKRVLLFEQFINEAAASFFIKMNDIKFDKSAESDPIWKTISPSEGLAVEDNIGYLIDSTNIDALIKLLDQGIFDKKYVVGSWKVRNDNKYGDEFEGVATKDLKDEIIKMGWIAEPDNFKAVDVDTTGLKEVDETLQAKMAKRYQDWERGVIKAWGSIFYMDYHSMPKSGKTQSMDQLKKDFTTIFKTDVNSDKFEELDDWIQEYGNRGGVPLFNKKVMDSIFMSIAKKTPAPFDFIIYRTADKEQDGVNSYTTVGGNYDGNGSTQRSYMIPKGTPIIFADADADVNEIIWMPTKAQLKKFRIS